jgi:hypothetical protein
MIRWLSLFLLAFTASAQLPGMGMLRVASSAPSISQQILATAPDFWFSGVALTYTNSTAPIYLADASGWSRTIYNTNSTGAVVTNGGLHFDGTTYYRVNDGHRATTTAWAPTGLCEDPAWDETMWSASYADSKLYHLTFGGTLLGSVSTSIPTNSIQGLARDTDGSFWVVDGAKTNVYHLDSSGSTLASTNLTGNFRVNGLALSGTNLLLISDLDNRVWNYSTTFVSNSVVTSTMFNGDGIAIDTNGNWIVFEDGGSYLNSVIRTLNPTTGAVISSNTVNYAANNIEHGFAVLNPNSKSYGHRFVAVDDNYHGTGTLIDRVMRFLPNGKVDDLTSVAGAVTIMGRMTIPAAFTSTTYIFGSAIGTSTNSARSAIFGSSTGKVVAFGRRLDADTGVQVPGATSPGTSNTVVSVVLNYATTTATVFIGGTQDGQSTSWLTAGSTEQTPAASTVLGASTAIGSKFLGQLNDLIVWKRALTPTEIAAAATLLSSQ